MQQTPLHQKEMDSLQKEIANEADGQELDGVGGVIDPLGEHGGSRAVEVDQQDAEGGGDGGKAQDGHQNVPPQGALPKEVHGGHSQYHQDAQLGLELKVQSTAPTGNSTWRALPFSRASATSWTMYRATRPMSRENRKF